MNLNQFLLLIQDLYMDVFYHSQLFSYALPTLGYVGFSIYVTMRNEGVYIRFPSCALKLSNLRIQFYLPAYTTINASIYLRRERKARGLITFLPRRLN
jgi:hypothetical protein